jgi:hypothetical protein
LNSFDYYKNPILIKAIDKHASYLKSHFDKEDFRQEVFAELYDFMPIDDSEAIKLINKVAFRFRKTIKAIYDNEISLSEIEAI